jgi:thiamine pyrophosphokinase
MHYKFKSSFSKAISQMDSIQVIGPMKLESYYKKSQMPIIFVDKGISYKKIFSIGCPYITVGDGDSSRKQMDLKAPIHKDYSDLSMALKLIPKEMKTIYLDGFFPRLRDEKRFDHLLANMGEVYSWAKKSNAKIYLNRKTIILPAGIHKLNIEGLFSLFSLEICEIKLTGKCDYQIISKKKLNPLSSLGLSNVGKGIINIEANKPLIIYLTGSKTSK